MRRTGFNSIPLIHMETGLTVTAFVLGVTQLVKDWGLVKGQYLQLVAIALGGLATWLIMYQPELWDVLSNIFLAAGITGTVSMVKSSVSH